MNPSGNLAGDITPGFEESLAGSAHLFSDWFGSGYFGLDLGFINIGWGFHDDVATMDVGFAAMRYTVEFADGEWHDQVGLHIGFGVGPLQVGIDYMGGVDNRQRQRRPRRRQLQRRRRILGRREPGVYGLRRRHANVDWRQHRIFPTARLAPAPAVVRDSVMVRQTQPPASVLPLTTGLATDFLERLTGMRSSPPMPRTVAANSVAKAVNDGDYARNNAAEKMLDNAAQLATAAPAGGDRRPAISVPCWPRRRVRSVYTQLDNLDFVRRSPPT